MKQHDQALLYLRKAAEDEALLDEVLHSPRVSDAAIGFHLQQAAEKLLKALFYLGVRFRKTHDLIELIDLLREQGLVIPGFLEDIDFLTPYAVEFRYDLLPWESETSLDRQQGRRLIQE